MKKPSTYNATTGAATFAGQAKASALNNIGRAPARTGPFTRIPARDAVPSPCRAVRGDDDIN